MVGNEREGRCVALGVVGVLTPRYEASRLGGGGEQEMDDRKQNGRRARSQSQRSMNWPRLQGIFVSNHQDHKHM